MFEQRSKCAPSLIAYNNKIMLHQMKLRPGPFKKIVGGQKIIESRLFDEKRQKIRVGDKIEFTSNDNSDKKVTTKVVALFLFKSFDDLFSELDPQLFGGSSKDALLNEIEQFYSPAEQEKYGVVGIKIQVDK
ncbi:MAG: ASCH domain-containing protein [Candidatus Andersenbacteria bacterium]